MLFVIKLVGFLVCAGLLAFGGVKTVQEVKINEMISEIDTVVENTPFFPEIDPPAGGGEETPNDPPAGGGSESKPGDSDVGGGSESKPNDPPTGGGNETKPNDPPAGGGSESKPNDPPAGGGNETEPSDPPKDDESTKDAITDAFGGLYDNNDPDFKDMNKEFFVGMLEGVLNGSSDDSDTKPPVGGDDFDEDISEDDFSTDFNPDEFVPDAEPDDDDSETSSTINDLVINMGGNYYENLQKEMEKDIEMNKNATEEEKQAAKKEFIEKETAALEGLLNIATKPEETTDEQLLDSVDAVLKSDVCLGTVTDTVNSDSTLSETIQDANIGESVKAEIENKINDAMNNTTDQEKMEQYKNLADIFGITLGGTTPVIPDNFPVN